MSPSFGACAGPRGSFLHGLGTPHPAVGPRGQEPVRNRQKTGLRGLLGQGGGWNKISISFNDPKRGKQKGFRNKLMCSECPARGVSWKAKSLRFFQQVAK